MLWKNDSRIRNSRSIRYIHLKIRASTERIAEKGLILSEYPIGTRAHPGIIPTTKSNHCRSDTGNMWLLRLTNAVDHLITADLRLKQVRDVFAVPGPITSPKSRGATRIYSARCQNGHLCSEIYWKSIDWACQMQNNFHKEAFDRNNRVPSERIFADG